MKRNKLSVVVPFFNERENLKLFYKKLLSSLKKMSYDWEIVFVNDGSTDKGEIILEKLIKNNSNVKLISHRKRGGKGKALNTGIQNSDGEMIIFMDADLQDDPGDIPLLIKKIEHGYEFVNGFRTNRQDNLLIKAYSKLFNFMLKKIFSSPFSDINCGLKAFKRKVLDGIIFYSNNFRFLPLMVYFKGYRVGEVKVHNHPRFKGKSKFGVGKIFIGILDTFTAYFLFKFSERPLHFFGLLGGALFLTGFLLGLYLSIERLVYNKLLYRRPILFLAILLMTLGTQIVMTGFLGELIVYFEKKRQG